MAVTVLEHLTEVLGHIAEDVTAAEVLAADIDDQDLDRKIHVIRMAVFAAGKRVGELEP